ncbi:Pyridoxamine--pyruvate transaminase [Fusobacterium sp. DD29]|uniref:pyridoxal-phosphate-dependent aminotransferase family protein n=1 Tax=unclassified Fusobacterium TaxID=2648384 RepID=UPI001B8D5F9F|nr:MULTISPECIES: alanine--glyoxylate aminotransferase family protein [unclassified Fusobacterium]MBR8701523.1 Pyridoxamine--pyruvate transaminase [Fusobacterium sp. DD45]MBR8711245.1 Pyridoxamine--pyruvate transaminase [Fusobacterium sp. DD28]MBR8750388.1 Pyridoxamine--pyruvate transaminase [Fusobacterium sp. DD29]MBR8751794.1 Pyridoxamine--pyruvate transaminase [Fusobacterium sp. DD26]MBR8762626.1 Pyridoxamine--pyruvate transaminase [Fusobacterium sp. DD25]
MKKANYIMMTPGPTMVRENVTHTYTHYYGNSDFDENFFEFYGKVCKKVGKIWGAKKAQNIIMCGEGMLGLDSACASLTEKGDKVLVLSNGIYGKGFKELIENYGGEVTLFESDDKDAIDKDKLRVFLEQHKDEGFKYATVVHCDTPSGVLNDIKDICKTLKSMGIMTVVDTVSAFGGTEVKVDEWGIDIALGASQKVLSSNTGLTIMAISDDAWKAIENRKTPIPSFYCNLSYWRNCVKEKFFPYTMPIADIVALSTAVDNMFEEGLDKIIERHYISAETTRSRLMEMGFDLYLKGGYSPTVTAFCIPEGYDLNEIYKHMLEKYEVMLGKSYGYLADKVLRIGHMGENSRFYRIDYTLGALEKTLKDLKK